MSSTGTAKEAQKPTASNGNPTDWTEETKAMLASKTKQPTLTDEDKTVLMKLDHLLHDRGCTISKHRTGQAYSLADFEYQRAGPYIKISSNCGHGGMFAGQRIGIVFPFAKHPKPSTLANLARGIIKEVESCDDICRKLNDP